MTELKLKSGIQQGLEPCLAESWANLLKQKVEIEAKLETKKDTENNIRAFQSELAKVANLDINDEQILKMVIEKFISKMM